MKIRYWFLDLVIQNGEYEFHSKSTHLTEGTQKFDAEEWADLFQKAGAQFAGPVAEHHDGFSMWNSKVNPWNAANMGPKRNVVAELEKAIRGKGMKFMAAFHHAENWFFYPHWKPAYDTSNPQYAGL